MATVVPQRLLDPEIPLRTASLIELTFLHLPELTYKTNSPYENNCWPTITDQMN